MEKQQTLKLEYLNGFGNCFATEALEGAIPAGKCYESEVKIAL